MKKPVLFFAVFLLLFAANARANNAAFISPDENGVLYVDSAAAPGGDGSSWATALNQLADALKAAEQINDAAPATVKQIWVTSGTYYPLYTPEANMTARDKTFTLVKDVVVYGGFAGTETDFYHRGPTKGKGTILSGDIGVRGNASDNAYHVATAISDTGAATSGSDFVLGYVTITGGNANGTSSVQIKGRTVYRNEGGGLDCRFGYPVLLNCLFVKNSAVNGGAILNAYGSGIGWILNCTFADNPDSAGKAIYNYNTVRPLQVTNCIVMDGIRYEGPQPEISYSFVQGMPADAANHILDGNTNPYFENAATGDYRLAVISPAINAGDNSMLNSPYDLAGYTRIYDVEKGGVVDMGAYEYQRDPIRPDANGILYVDSAAAPGGDGSSWATAIPQLADALKAAEQLNSKKYGTVDQIWATSGTYYPLYTPEPNLTDRDKTFMLPKNVVISGGFAGTESSIDQRATVTGGGTILSGDLGARGNTSDNAYHVVTIVGDTSLISGWILGNVTVTGGNANGTSTVQIKGRTVYRNEGGGLDCRFANPVLLNCLFVKNNAVNGAAIMNAHGNGTGLIINCTFSDNADNVGKAIYNYNTGLPLQVTNSVVMDGIRYAGPQPAVNYSLVEGMPADAAKHILDGNINPQFKNPSTGNYRLTGYSPLINAGVKPLETTMKIMSVDLGGAPRIYDAANGGIIDIGAYEFQIQPDANGILYVDSAAAPGGDGSSWATAVPKLSDALHYARVNTANWAGDSLRIYVAKGTYLPEYRADDSTKAVNDRNAAFVMVKNVQLFGGFPGGGGVRNWAANPTVLSGDIGTANDTADNAYHVVISAGNAGNALLNGFTITGGNATGSGTITVNSQTAQVIAGGGVYTVASDLHLTNLKISGNTAQSGGGIYSDASAPVIINALITGNTASTTGGGIRVFNCLLSILTNVTISGNMANFGGGIASANSHLRALNSILFGNSAATGKNVYNSAQGTVFQFCLMEGTAPWNSSWGVDFGHNLITTNNPFADTASGNYQLVVSSPAINAGSNQFYTQMGGNLAGDIDLAGNARVYNQSSGGIIDIGAYELQRGPIHPDANGVMYVDSSAASGGDGSSWTTALSQLADALKAAREINNSAPGTVKEIWATSGTYYPLYTPEANMTDRDKTFMLVKDVVVYGGFAGTETSAAQRTPITGGGTILSGDIGVRGATSDNAYHVVTAIGDIADSSKISGFGLVYVTITGGNANGTSNVQIKGRTVYRNEGGGLDSRFANPVLLNCLFVKNNAVNGAAIMNAYGDGLVINCTFAGNADNAGKAIYNYDNTGFPLQVMSSIVMDGIRYTGLQPAVKYSLVQGMPANTTNHILDGNANPYFENAATGDYRLSVNSPAINAGNSPFDSAATDLANNPRIIGSAIDMGAYEYQGNPVRPDANGIMYVDSAAAPGGDGSSWATALPKLSDALHFARTNAADRASDSLRIYVAKGTYFPEYRADDSAKAVNDRNAAFVMVKNVQLFGGFPNGGGARNRAANPTILSGDIGTTNDAADNAFHVVVSAGDAGDALLNGFTITKGNANRYDSIIVNGQNVLANLGGGIFSNSSSPTLTNVKILGNMAINGAGITNMSANPVLTDVTISGNTASFNGGGVINITNGTANIGADATFRNVIISGNWAGNVGGGIINLSSSPTFTNVTISGNKAISSGGGMYNSEASPHINNSLLFGNTAPTGDNIFTSDGTATFRYTLIEGSTGWDNSWGTDGGNNVITTTNPFADTAAENYQLIVSSQAVNAGNNQLYSDAGGDWANDKDLAGNTRVYNQTGGGIIDMGAYEYQGMLIIPDANGIVYVDSAATSGGDGSSWATAVPKLSEALHYARTNAANWASDSLRIYVAKGTYLPEYRADDSSKAVNDRNATFVMVKNVQLFGGFPHGGGVRNRAANPTILSGDIGTPDDFTDNAYHVVVFSGDAGNAALNGMIISGGNANINNYIIVNGSDIYQNRGGGMYINNHSSPTISNTTISNNSADNGGGMINYNYSSPAILNTIISDNSANNGGGMSNYTHSSPTISNTMISNNSAEYGGGIYNFQSPPAILNTTISNNLAQTSGGGIYNDLQSSPAINNAIIFGNRMTDASVSNIANSSTFSIPVFKNSLVGGATSWNADWGMDGGNTIVTTINPFTDTANGDFSLIPGPAIDGGSNTLYTDAGGDLANDKDLAGNPRVYDLANGGIVDMGAYEFHRVPVTPGSGNILYVNQNVSGGNGSGDSWANAIPQLADALKWARQQQDADNNWLQNDSLRIFIAKGTYQPLYSAEDGVYMNDSTRDNAFVMVKNVQLYGGFDPVNGIDSLNDTRIFDATGTILSGDIGTPDDSTDNTYHVVVASGDAGNAALNGLTISGGNADGGDGSITVNKATFFKSDGGGMYNWYSSPTILNTMISNNTAKDNGGGMYNYFYSSPAILNTKISGNSASWGGGMSTYLSSSAILNTIISNNSARNDGGGMYNSTSSPTILNTMISNNSAKNNGGGMYNRVSSSPAIQNTTIANNSAQTGGGGMYNRSSSPAIHNSIIFGNRLADASVSNISNEDVSTLVFKYSLVEGATSWNTGWGMDGGNNIVTTANPFEDTVTGNYQLIASSPAVNAGSNALYAEVGGNPANDKDLAGNARVYNEISGGIIDIGAYEFQGNVVSTKITSQPADVILCEDEDATFKIEASGGNLSYQWQSSLDNRWNNINGETKDSLNVLNAQPSDSGTIYRVIVSGTTGKDTSAFATLSVRSNATVTIPPKDSTVTAGDNVSFSVSATGTIAGYQWQVSTDGTNWTDVTGETTEILELTNIGTNKNGNKYRAIVTGACSNDTSMAAMLTVNTPVLTLAPASLASGYMGVLYPAVIFSASGGKSPYTYTETGTLPNGLTFVNGILSGTPTQSGNFPISIKAIDNTAGNLGGPFSVTKNYTLVINTGGSCITVASYPQSQKECEGGDVSFNIKVTGATGYQWQNSSDGGKSWADIKGETNAVLSLSNVAFSETPVQYRVIVKSNCGNITSGSATLTVGANAAITAQPKNTAVCENGNATFNVSARGTNPTYQWQSSTDGTNWNDVSNGTSETLNLSNIGLAKNGTEYHVIVSSDCGTVTSDSAKLSVRANVAITKQPQDITASEGGNATFSVVAIGAVSYQWKSSVDGNTWKVLNGETATSLQLSNISASADGTKYIVVITGACGVITSENATLSVTANPVITLSPGTLPDATIGTAFSAIVTASGGTAPYNYELTGNLPAGISFNTTTGEFSGTPTEAGTFNGITIKATDKNNFSGSRVYSLTVNPPVLTLDPASLPFGFAGIPYSQTFTANGGTAPYTYSVSGTLPDNITLNEATGVLSGTTNETGTFNNIKITASDASTGTGVPFTVSKTYTLVINSGGSCIAITSPPQNQTVCEGSDATFSIAVTGAKSYQWESSINGGSNWHTIPGATGSTLSLTNVLFSETPVQYHVIVHSSCGDIISGSAMLIVRVKAAITTQPQDATVCENGNTSFSVSATGTNITYQWQSSTDGKTWNNVTTSGTSATLNLTGVASTDNGTEYHVIVSSNCGRVTSDPAMLTVNTTKHTILNETICNGSAYNFGGKFISQSGTYSDTLAAAAGCDSIVVLNLTVRPKIKTTLDKTICFGSAYNFGGNSISKSGTYSDTMTSATGCDSVVVLNLTVRPEIKTTLNETICFGVIYNFGRTNIGQSGTYYDTLSAATGCDSIIVLNLQVRPEIKTTLDETICEGSTYTIGAYQYTQPGTYYDTLHAASGCDSIVVLHLTVNANPVITIQPSGATADIGGNAVFRVAATGTITGYQWQSSGDGGATWDDEANGTTKTFELSNIGTGLNGTRYRVIVKGVCGNDTSAAARLMVNMQVTWDPPGDTLSTGYEAVPYTDSVMATDGTGSTPIYTEEGALPPSVTIDPETGKISGTPTNTGSYLIIVTATFPAGNSDTTYSQSKDYTIVVEANGACIHITSQPQNLTACEGNTAAFSIGVSTDAGTIGYQWQSSSDGTHWKDITGAAAKTLNISDVPQSANGNRYRVIVSNSCGSVTSDAAMLKVNAKTTITTQPERQAVCSGGNAAFSVKATGTDIKYQWQSSVDGTTWNDVSGAVKPTLRLSEVTASDNGKQYHVIVSGVCDHVTSDKAALTVNPLPDISITADSTNPVSKGDVIHLTASGAGSYRWDFATGIQGGLNDAVLQVRPADNTTYHVTGTTAAGCSAEKDYAVQVMTDYQIFANNIVSPNGDGKNDTWFIRNIDMYPTNEVMIYDRSGRIIYHKKSYDNQWNGMLNGGPLHEGTYYYVFIVDGGKKVFKGFIELLRDK